MTKPYEPLAPRELLDVRQELDADVRDPAGAKYLHLARRLLVTLDQTVNRLARQLSAEVAQADTDRREWDKERRWLNTQISDARVLIERLKRDVEAAPPRTSVFTDDDAAADQEALARIAQLTQSGTVVGAVRAHEIARGRLK